MKKTAFVFALICSLFSCKESPKSEAIIETESESAVNSSVEKESTVETPQYPSDQKFEDFSSFIAAMEGSQNSPFKDFETKEVWLNYKNNVDRIWEKTNSKLPVMRKWSQSEMEDANQDGGTLFYPFSGPDFLHADVFFPNYDSIVMIGLEPIGSYPDMTAKMKDSLGEIYLNGVHKSLHALLGLSFFRTIAMAKDFNGEVDGTLPVLIHFMKRTDHKVLFQEKVALEANGSLTTDLSKAVDSTYFGNRFYFQRNGEEKIRVLTYFAVNLQNSPYVSRGGLVAKGLKSRTDFVAFLEQLNMKSTYLKSASYLMHRETFSIVRDIILNQSTYVLQDDSGIPVGNFDRNQWELTFYGNYEQPISLFDERLQEDLTAIYDSSEIVKKELPFGIGYQYHKGSSNLMKATRK